MRLLDEHPDGACADQRGVQDRAGRIGQVPHIAARDLPQAAQAWVGEHLPDKSALSPGEQGSREVTVEHPQQMLADGTDEGVGLVGPASREPLLRPAPGRGARLHVARPNLVRKEVSALDQSHGIPTPPDQDHRER